MVVLGKRTDLVKRKLSSSWSVLYKGFDIVAGDNIRSDDGHDLECCW